MPDERFQFLYDFQVNDSKLEHSARLIDQVNAGLERSTRALRGFETAAGGFGRIGDGARQAHSRVLDLAAALNVVGTAVRVIGGAGGMAFAALDRWGDEFVKASGERTSTVRGYTTFLGGNKQQAELEFFRAQEFAQKTDFTSEATEKGQSRLMAQGLRGHELYANLFGAADLAAASPDDKNETLKRVTMAMGQIKAKGKLQGEELTQQLAEAGLNSTLVLEEVRKSLKLKSLADVTKLMGKGEVTADVALPAIQRAILAQLGISKLGEFATGSAGSITSLMSNVGEGKANLLKSFDLDEAVPGAKRFKQSLVDIGSNFDATTRRGQNLAFTMQAMGNTILNARSFANDFEASFLSSFGGSFSEQLHKDTFSESGLGSVSNMFKDLGDALGKLGIASAKAFEGISGLNGGLGGFINNIGSQVGMLNALAQGDYKTASKMAMENLAFPLRSGRQAAGAVGQELRGASAGGFVRGALRRADWVGIMGKEFAESVYSRDSSADVDPEYKRYQDEAAAGLTPDGSGLRGDPGGGRLMRRNPLDPRLDFAKMNAAWQASGKATKKKKHEAGWNIAMSNYEPWFADGSGPGGSVVGANPLGSIVESSMQRPAGGNSIIVNQAINIQVHSDQVAQSVASQLRTARDTIADELRSLARAPRASARG